MKTKLFILLAVVFVGFTTSSNVSKDLNHDILGEWCNPYTYQSSGEIKGYEFKKGGKINFMGVKATRLENWSIENDQLTIKGKKLDDNGAVVGDYITVERIEILNKDTLQLVAKEEAPRLVFIYVRPSVAKKMYGKEVKEMLKRNKSNK